MTVREYLSQGYMLEQRIACDMRKAEAARTLAASIPSPRTDASWNGWKKWKLRSLRTWTCCCP